MKDIILLVSVGLLATIFLSCNKDKNSDSRGLTGSWEIRYSEGGLRVSGGGLKTYPPGNGYIQQFTDSKYYLYQNGQSLGDSGTYKIEKDATTPYGQKMDKLTYITNNNRVVYYQIAADTLTIYDGNIAADGTVSKYVPLQK